MTLRTTISMLSAGLLAATTLGCSDSESPMMQAEDETGGIVVTAGQTGSDAGDVTGTDSAAGDSFGETGDETGSGPPLQCTEVDFVFVIDNSASMADEQQHLVQAAPGFVEAMKNNLPSIQSFRVGVVDTDTYPALGLGGDPLDGCPDGTDCTGCDYQLGAFLTKPQSAADPAVTCDISSGATFMDGDADNFASEFQCTALVGAQGNPVERQAAALVSAVSPELNAAGACNDGFIRDDALLVFLVISDEEDNHQSTPAPQGGSMGEPTEWFDAIVAAKGGKASNVVALGLLGGSPKFEDCAELSGVEGAEQSSRLSALVESFPTNFVGSVCSDGYADFFADALAKVSEGCQNFIP